MTPIEIVRAMLAEHECKHGIAPQGAPFPRRGDTAVHAAYHDALLDVIAALESADSAPRLEWKRRPVPSREAWSAESLPYESLVQDIATRKYHVLVTWIPPGSGTGWQSHIANVIAATIEQGQRIAELVIHRHRQMLDEIARVK
jgi:hypothetical protein